MDGDLGGSLGARFGIGQGSESKEDYEFVKRFVTDSSKREDRILSSLAEVQKALVNEAPDDDRSDILASSVEATVALNRQADLLEGNVATLSRILDTLRSIESESEEQKGLSSRSAEALHNLPEELEDSYTGVISGIAGVAQSMRGFFGSWWDRKEEEDEREDRLRRAGLDVGSLLGRLTDAVKDGARVTMGIGRSLLSDFFGFDVGEGGLVARLVGGIVGGLKALFTGGAAKALAIGGSIYGAIGGAWETADIFDVAHGDAPTFAQSLASSFGGIFSAMTLGWVETPSAARFLHDELPSRFRELFGSAFSFVSENLPGVLDQASSLISRLWEGIRSGVSEVSEISHQMFNDFVDEFGPRLDAWASTQAGRVRGAISGFVDRVRSAFDIAVQSAVENVESFVFGLWGSFTDRISETWNTVISNLSLGLWGGSKGLQSSSKSEEETDAGLPFGLGAVFPGTDTVVRAVRGIAPTVPDSSRIPAPVERALSTVTNQLGNMMEGISALANRPVATVPTPVRAPISIDGGDDFTMSILNSGMSD